MKDALLLLVLFAVSRDAGPSHDLADALLRLPAAERETTEQRVRQSNGPAALTGDEPLSVLEMLRATSPELITPAVRSRMLARLKADPSIVFEAYQFLPDTPAAASAAASAVGQLNESGQKDERLKAVREWIRRRGNFERPQLIAAAAAAQDEDGWIDGEDDLRALAQLDWDDAAPILARLAGRPAPRVSALAHVLMYEHAYRAELRAGAERTILQKIAEDRAAPARARTLAIEALLASEWPDRDQWYLKLFADESLLGPTDGMYLLMPLSSPVEKDPDHWIPILATLASSNDLIVRSNAANLLGDFQLDRARADALGPLLPWLKDPEWARDVSMTRLRLTQSLPRVDLSSAIPALEWMCEHESDETVRVYAAMSLVELSAPGAMNYVRIALEGADAFASAEVTQAIVGSSVLSENEMANAIIAFAEVVSTEEGASDFNERLFSLGNQQKPLPLDVVLGYRLAAEPPDSVVVAERLLGRMQPADGTSAVLQRVVSRMRVPSARKSLVQQLGAV